MSKAPEGMIPVEEFAKLKKSTPSKIIDMIREGFYIGRKVGDEWFIDDTESNNSATNPLKTKGAFSVSTKGGSNEIIVTDIQMPFFSMVVFMVKWVIASIPAFIILFIIFSVVAAIFGGVVAGLNGPGY